MHVHFSTDQKTTWNKDTGMVVVVSTSRSENSTKRSQLFTQFAVVSTFYTSQGDIYSQWEIVKK